MKIEIEGKIIQIDPSGQGHAWQTATEETCPADVQQEIAAEIIDGQQSQRTQAYVASNGLHYRWD